MEQGLVEAIDITLRVERGDDAHLRSLNGGQYHTAVNGKYIHRNSVR